MTMNVGKADRYIRLFIGAAVIALGIIYQNKDRYFHKFPERVLG